MNKWTWSTVWLAALALPVSAQDEGKSDRNRDAVWLVQIKGIKG